jgi:hypothetical protein
MRAHRAWSTSYLVSGFAISIVLGAATGEARAQVDPNLQSRINTFSPPITAVEIAPQAPPAGAFSLIEKTTGTRCPPKSRDEIAGLLEQSPQFRAWSISRAVAQKKIAARDFNTAATSQVVHEAAQRCVNGGDKSLLSCFKAAALPIQPVNWTCPVQPTTLKFTFVANPTYETNVLKSNQNIHSDTSLGLNGTGLFTTAGLRDYDIIAFIAQSASARYTNFPSKSLDTLTVQGLYQFFLDGHTENGMSVKGALPSDTNTNRITYDVLAIGFVNQTAFVPTFQMETANLFTPQATLARQNIGLTDLGCTPLFNGDPTKPGYCYFANISVTAGQTFSDVATLQNANIALSGTVNKRFDHTDWVLSLAGMATAKSFEDVPGGRQDLLLQLGPQLAYTPSKCVSLSVSVTYYRNYSSLATAAWDGFIVQPTFNVIFPVEPSGCG